MTAAVVAAPRPLREVASREHEQSATRVEVTGLVHSHRPSMAAHRFAIPGSGARETVFTRPLDGIQPRNVRHVKKLARKRQRYRSTTLTLGSPAAVRAVSPINGK